MLEEWMNRRCTGSPVCDGRSEVRVIVRWEGWKKKWMQRKEVLIVWTIRSWEPTADKWEGKWRRQLI
jgi:hypothetical protein